MSNGILNMKYAGFLVSILLFFSFIYLLNSTPFPHSTFLSNDPRGNINLSYEDAGSEMAGFLWDYRGLDLLFQTIFLFATAISCLALLREAKN
jgi:multisubunit Na+/H+ antiporter MnhB subunit